MFLVARAAAGCKQNVFRMMRRRIMAAQASLLGHWPEVNTSDAGVAGIALLPECSVRRRDRPAGERFRAHDPMRYQPGQRQHGYSDRQQKAPPPQGMRPREV